MNRKNSIPSNSDNGVVRKQGGTTKVSNTMENKNIISLSKLKVHAEAESGVYRIYWPAMNRIIGELRFPRDNQYILDVAALESITDVMSQRFNITQNKIKTSSTHNAYKGQNNYMGIYFSQLDFSHYEFYLPNGFSVAWIASPGDWKMGQDLAVIKEVCAALAMRYNLI